MILIRTANGASRPIPGDGFFVADRDASAPAEGQEKTRLFSVHNPFAHDHQIALHFVQFGHLRQISPPFKAKFGEQP
jgi:hypothetical protein